MELIERYIYAVTRQLPQTQREEVAKELRSDIQDMVDSASGTEKAKTKKVLESLGHPELLAQRYTDATQYLIGPKWYGIYLFTLKKVGYVAIPVVAIIIILNVLLDAPQDQSFIKTIIESIFWFIGTLMQTVFWVTLCFVLIERNEKHIKKEDLMLEWSVDSLPELPKERSVKLFETLVNSALYIGLAVFIMLNQYVIGLGGNDGSHISFFNASLQTAWLPAIIALLLGLAIKELWIAKAGKVTRSITALSMALNTLLVGVFTWLYFTNQLVNQEFANRVQGVLGDEVSFEWIVGVSVIIYVAGYVWDMITGAVRLVKK